MVRVLVLALLMGSIGLITGAAAGSGEIAGLQPYQPLLATSCAAIGVFLGAAVGTAGVLRDAIESEGKRVAEALKSGARHG
jgi:hypothetical protein